MNILWLLILALICFWLAYRYYAGYITAKFGIHPRKKTPAVEKNDGIDFVPTGLPILFAHHYATIAGAGPIIGPTLNPGPVDADNDHGGIGLLFI